ncbi:hypothetical protein HPB47_024026 [Ixodes persulcatus]|uniref:Uncharacterized protein n=1 Tax=Ixodes persulcatus TaxID=34615 RepID=A0AC60Q5E9_IXOPE|nr:hypothetical protein HPB47_024026 [Ixodes persulcatus]
MNSSCIVGSESSDPTMRPLTIPKGRERVDSLRGERGKGIYATHILLVNVLTLTNDKLGQTMLFNYTGQLSASLTSSPVFNFTMTKQSDGSVIPCILNLGSCVYKMCGGNTTREQEIGEPWNNVCPIAPLNYTSSVGIKIPSIALLIIGDYLRLSFQLMREVL